MVDSYVGRLLAQMNRAFPDALVDGWPPLVETISLPDATDRHVVAAALSGRADVIVTENQKDFPPEELPVSMFSQTADTFLLDSLDLHPQRRPGGRACSRHEDWTKWATAERDRNRHVVAGPAVPGNRRGIAPCT